MVDNKIVKSFSIALLFFSISLYSFSSADSLDCRLVGRFDVTCFAIFVKDNFAYIGDGGYFKIYNIQNPSNPDFQGQVSEPTDVNGIYVVGNVAYVADGTSGLRIIDVSSPSSPSQIKQFLTAGVSSDVCVVDNLAYVADGTNGLLRINVSDPNNPDQTGRYNTPGSAFGVYVVDDLAYVADHSAGLQIFNISSPDTLLRIGYLPMGGYADGIHVKDTIAYVASGIPGLRIINVSDPTDPSEIENISTSDYAKDVYVENNLAYVADRVGGLRIILVLDPTNPTEVGYYDTNADYAEDVYVKDKDTLVYVAAGNDGFYIIKYIGDAGVEEGLEEITSVINNLSEVKINYHIKDRTRINISVYNILGQRITSLVNTVQTAGNYTVKWSGRPGIYFVRMEIGRYTYKEKVIILR